MDAKSVWFYVLVLIFQFVCGQNSIVNAQYSNSPCPGIFGFEKDGDNVYGIITVKPPHGFEPLSALEIRFNYTVVNRYSDDRGRLEALSSENLRMYNQGQAARYRVHFPVISPLPKVTALIVNGDIICSGPGDESEPGKRVSRITLWKRTRSKSAVKPETPRPAYEPAVTAPTQNYNLPASRPVVTASVHNRFPNTPITTDECGVVAGGNERVPLIFNGNFYERGEVPWLVAIFRVVAKTLHFICGGTLVSDRHVVTAAHCMRRPSASTPIAEIVVRMGAHGLNDWSDDLTVARKLMAATIHEDYDPNTLQNDILILTLDKRVKYNRYIRPACLWSGDTELSRVVGAIGVVAGWGDRSVESIGVKEDEPQMVRVPIVSTKECRASKSEFHQLTYDTTLCAGERKGAGPCRGDSGSGLYLLDDGKWKLRGVVSLSLKNTALTCDLNEYIVFTDTAQFLPWMRNILSKNYFD